MKLQHVVMAAAVAATSAGFGALAQDSTRVQASDVVRGGSIHVQPMDDPASQDAILLGDAVRAIESDRATNTALLTMVANNGQLTVNGNTVDAAQSARIETKLKALHGGTKVSAWFDSWSGSSQ